MSENWNESEPYDARPPEEVIRDRVGMLGAVFNRKVTESLIAVFQDALKGFPNPVLKHAFLKAESQLEKFPTPKILKAMCNEEMPDRTWKYNFEASQDQNPEGKEIQVLIDPDPTCANCREPRSAHPVKLITGLHCERYRASALGDDTVMFRPQDCPEGRAFLKKLAEVAGRKS